MQSAAIFCKVVDNYGDIGICWRLARQLCGEHGLATTLWVDDLATFARIEPSVDVGAACQDVRGVTVRHWSGQDLACGPQDVADLVIEFFGVDLPPTYIEAMAQRTPRAVWINFEGLSAEEWVEGCHALPSMHPRLPLTKYFFFPGFTARTGGLLRERDLLARRAAFGPAQRAALLRELGVTEEGRLLSLFCYPHAPLAAAFAAWRGADEPLTCLVPEGVARDTVGAFLGAEPVAGAARRDGALTLRVIPFLPQERYDELLWSCDLNVVRGEDSFVRAQWAGRPFIWHIYPQSENLHHKKLRAFLGRYAPELPALAAWSLAWNGAAPADDLAGPWRGLMAEMPRLAERALNWEKDMEGLGDVVSNLLAFAATHR